MSIPLKRIIDRTYYARTLIIANEKNLRSKRIKFQRDKNENQCWFFAQQSRNEANQLIPKLKKIHLLVFCQARHWTLPRDLAQNFTKLTSSGNR
jgi:hypothetical protein